MTRAKKPMPPGLKPWVEGQSGNPSGRPKMSAEERKLISLSKKEVARLLNLTCGLSRADMIVKYKDDNTSAIEALFIKCVIDGLNGDSVKAAEFILNRTVGKPTDNVQITSLKRVIKKLDGTVIEYSNGPENEQE